MSGADAPWENDVAVAATPAPAAPADQPWLADQPAAPQETAGRLAGVAARGLAGGAAGLPNMLATLSNPIGTAVQPMVESAMGIKPDTGPYKPQLSDFVHPEKWQQAAEYFAEKGGAPAPATPAERIVSRAAEAVPSAVLTPAAPIAGALSAAAGGAASQGVAEAGGGKVAQVVAGTLAGGATGLAAGAVRGAVGGAEGAAEAAAPNSREAAVQTLKNEDIPLSVSQATGSKLAQHIERASAMTGDAAGEFASEQGAAFNRAVLKRIGVTDPNVTAATPDVLGPAREAITGGMDAIAAKTPVTVDDELLGRLGDIQKNASRVIPESHQGPINANIDDILANASQNGGKMDGLFYQKLNSNLGALASDPKLAPVVSDMRDAVNDALARSASPEDLQTLSTLRQQYRALKQIEPAVDPATGNISPMKLLSSLNVKANRGQTLYGRGDQDLVTLAKAAKNVLPDKLGNSGTAERALPTLGVLETLGSGEPMKAAGKLAAVVAGTRVAGAAMRSQRTPSAVAGAKSGAVTGGLLGALDSQQQQ